MVTKEGNDILLPAGATCHGEETDNGDARASSVDHDSPATAVQVVSGQSEEIQALEITATNEFAASPDDGGGLLPFTGAALPWWMALVGLLSIGAGAVVIRRRP